MSDLADQIIESYVYKGKISVPAGKTVSDFEKEQGAKFNKKKVPFWDAVWAKLEGNLILQIPGSKYAALPTTGKKNASAFVVFNVDERKEITQLKKSEVRTWLAQKAKNEKVKPTGYV